MRVWAGFGLLLFAATWKLWTPQTEFPQIPFFGFLVAVPGWIDWAALGFGGLSLLLIGATSAGQIQRRGAVGFAVSAAVLILLDQHRLQPWAYQYLVFAILIAATRVPSTSTWMRWIIVSVYFYSAISKFDFQFVHTVGAQILTALAGLGMQNTADWPAHIKNGLVLGFPMGELLVGLLLAVPRWRRWGKFMAWIFHGTLLIVLGPWGLQHQFGVLLWNLFFMIQVGMLFESGRRDDGNPSRRVAKPQREHFSGLAGLAQSCGNALAIFVLLFPIAAWFGIGDHWPGWEVYAPRSSRAEFELPRRPTTNDRTTIAEWSLKELGVPVYPQARFQLAVAIAVAEKYSLNRGFRVELKSRSNRWTGARTSQTLSGRDQLVMAARRYWLNTQARRIWFVSPPQPVQATRS